MSNVMRACWTAYSLSRRAISIPSSLKTSATRRVSIDASKNKADIEKRMSVEFVPPDFAVPTFFQGANFWLEPLAAKHNERDYEAWTSSVEHIRTTPGMGGRDWPHDMTLEQNLEDMNMHWTEFQQRAAFTYSILTNSSQPSDDGQVIGCIYIYPEKETGSTADAHVRSWVRESHANMDALVWRTCRDWLLGDEWPFRTIRYAERSN